MESSNSHTLLPKWGRLRKKPQPLTDLTQLYSKIANETIYYLKLEERGEYMKALQGWKALNTDVLYQTTVIDHTYPNTQSFTKDELSLKSGLRELYHKACGHLERLQAKCKDIDQRKEVTSPRNSVNHGRNDSITSSISSNSSFTKNPIYLDRVGLQNSTSKKLIRTLRNPKTLPLKHQYPNPSAYSHKDCEQSSKINFSTSKSLARPNQLLSKKSNGSTSSFNSNDVVTPSKRRGPAEDLILIDLATDSDNEDKTATSSSKNKNTIFEIEDYYDNYLDLDQRDLERLKTLDDLGGTGQSLSKFSLDSSPLIPSSFSGFTHVQSLPEELSATYSKVSQNGLKTKSSSSTSSQHNTSLANLKATKSTPTLLIKTKSLTKGNVLKSSSTESLTNRKARNLKPSSKATPAVKKSNVNTIPPSNYSKQTAKSSPVNQSSRSSTKVSTKRTPDKTSTNIRPSASSGKVSRSKSPLINTKVNRRPDTNLNPNFNKTTKPTASGSNSTSQARSAPPAIPVIVPELQNRENEFDTPSKEDTGALSKTKQDLEDEIIDSLHGIDKQAAKQIFSEIVVQGDEVHWDDIAGLESAKASLKEAVVYPFLRPDLFRGLREPVRGMLLFGPPGTGKTMLARAVATESHSTFFSISASSLTSKFLGESEKLVRALFAVAKRLSPSIIFVDEIDSIMGSRDNEGENESSRRIKNEFLVQWSSLSNAAAGNDCEADDEPVLLLAATNLPWSIDDAARRRFVRRQYIPLPERETRNVHLRRLLSHQKHTLNEEDFEELLNLTDGFSGSDITSLAKDAAMGPLRELGEQLLHTARDQIRPIQQNDFKNSLNYIKPSVSQEGLVRYEEWASQFGSSGV